MSAGTLNQKHVALAKQIELVCAPPPANSMRNSARRRFEQSYFLMQEDQLYSLLRKARLDDGSLALLTAVAQHFMREGETERFACRSAFHGRWAHRSPKIGYSRIQEDMEYGRDECARLIAEMQSCCIKGNRGSAVHYALRMIKLEGALGIRVAALTELLNFEPATRARFKELIAAVKKTQASLP